MDLGFKVKVKLLELGKTQVWLANKIGVSKQNLNNVLNGGVNLKLEHLLEDFVNKGRINYRLYHNQDNTIIINVGDIVVTDYGLVEVKEIYSDGIVGVTEFGNEFIPCSKIIRGLK